MSRITPCLMFDGTAAQAARFYVSLLPDSRSDAVAMLRSGETAKIRRMTGAMFQMGKPDIAVLRRAFAGVAA